MKILLIRFTALGDVAMLAPIVREAALERPQDEFCVLSMPFCAPLFDDIAENVTFIGRNIKKDYKGVVGIYRLFKELDDMHFDLVCDMHDVLRTKMLRVCFHTHGYKVFKIDKHRKLRRLITAPEGKKVLKQLPTSFGNYRDVLRQALPDTKTVTPDNPTPNPPLSAFSRCFYKAERLKEPPTRIGIAPFAAHEGKIYPPEQMERLIALLSENIQRSSNGSTGGTINPGIYLFGGGGKERDTMEAWAEKFANVHLASETHKGLREELQLMRELDVMVSMDSANMHLASLVGTRVVSIWGATHPMAGFLGWQQSSDDCVQLELPCRPCSIYGNKPCIYGDLRCMKGIAPEKVMQRIVNPTF